MTPDLARVLQLLQRDVAVTLGRSHETLIAGIAADIGELNVDREGAKLVDDVQQYFNYTLR